MNRRRGVALFQLLAVLAFLAMLLGLLLPAVQKVREAAARMQSANNLKQIGIAMHSFHDVTGKLPAGVDGNGFSAHTHMLPYIEQENVYKLIDRAKKVDDKDNAKMRAVLIKTFLAPADGVVQPVNDLGPTNYLFAAGSKASLDGNDGAFYKLALKLTDFTDGTSNTICAVETLKGDGGKKAVSVSRQHVVQAAKALKGIKDDAGVKDWKAGKNIAGTRGSSWMDGRFLQGTFTATLPFSSGKPDVDCGGEGGLSAPRPVSNVVQVLLGDGSVRAVSPGLKFATWQAAITRSGGEVLGGGLVTATPLDREEHVEQAYFFRVLRERLAAGQATQAVLESVGEELLSTTRLPMAVQFLAGEVKHSGLLSTGFSRLTHYFTPFQAFVVEGTEDEKKRFDINLGLLVLEREAAYRAGGVSPAGLFVYQFEAMSRNRLGYDAGLRAMRADPYFDAGWKVFFGGLPGQLGVIDFADLLYLRSALYVSERRREEADYEPPLPPLFGEKEGKIARANGGRDPLYLFASLQRHLGYPEVPRPQARDDTAAKLETLRARMRDLEARMRLLEGELRGTLDLNKLMDPEKLKRPDDEW